MGEGGGVCERGCEGGVRGGGVRGGLGVEVGMIWEEEGNW